MDTGNEWKYLQQYAAPYGSKHLVTAYLRICTGFVFHEIWGTDSHIDLSDSVDQCGILPYPFRKDVQYKKKEKNDIKIETRQRHLQLWNDSTHAGVFVIRKKIMLRQKENNQYTEI